MKLEIISKNLLYSFNSEAELIKAIIQISENFTTNRAKLETYLKEEKFVSAYSVFYLSTNLKKLTACMDKIKLSLDLFSDYEFFDIGAGPGTFSLALLAENSDLKISSFETADLMNTQALKFVRAIYPNANYTQYDRLNNVPSKEAKRFGIFGHSANEMSEDTILNIITKLDLDEVLFIEPGTKEFFRKSLCLRDKLLKKFNMNYPCLSANSCAMSDDPTNWCHQYLSIKQDHDVERLTQLARKDRRSLPITLHHYSKNEIKSKSEESRIVRKYSETKFSFEYQVCQTHDDENKLNDLQLLKRPYSKKELKVLQLMLSGDSFEYSLEKSLENGKERGKIIGFS